MTEPIEAMAQRARREPYFLGFVLERYALAEGLDDAALADALGCTSAVLTDLRLCRAPRLDPAGLREDVDRIAAALGIDPVRLANVVKRSAVLARLQARSSADEGAGLLMAARDRDEEDRE